MGSEGVVMEAARDVDGAVWCYVVETDKRNLWAYTR